MVAGSLLEAYLPCPFNHSAPDNSSTSLCQSLTIAWLPPNSPCPPENRTTCMNHTYHFNAVPSQLDCMSAAAVKPTADNSTAVGSSKPNSSSIDCEPIHQIKNESFGQLNPSVLADLELNCSGAGCHLYTVSYPLRVPDEVQLLSGLPVDAFSLDIESGSYEITQIPGFNMSAFIRGQPACQLGVLPCPRGMFTGGAGNSTNNSDFTGNFTGHFTGNFTGNYGGNSTGSFPDVCES